MFAEGLTTALRQRKHALRLCESLSKAFDGIADRPFLPASAADDGLSRWFCVVGVAGTVRNERAGGGTGANAIACRA